MYIGRKSLKSMRPQITPQGAERSAAEQAQIGTERSERVESLDMLRWAYCWCKNCRQTLLNHLHTHTHNKYVSISFHDFTTSHRSFLSDVSEVLPWQFLPSKPAKPVIVKAVKSLEDALEALEAVEASAQLFWCELIITNLPWAAWFAGLRYNFLKRVFLRNAVQM